MRESIVLVRKDHHTQCDQGQPRKGELVHIQLAEGGNRQRNPIAPVPVPKAPGFILVQRQKTRETQHRFCGLTVREIIPQLYKSSTAGPMLCLSVAHLHRLKDSQGGPLIEGEHWFPGPTANSPIRWDVPAILELLRKRGQLRRQADQTLVEAGIPASKLREVGHRKPQAAGRKA